MKYNELYPSDWLRAADVARPRLTTIKRVSIESIADSEEKPVLHFMGDTKPMILNRTNGNTIREAFGEDTEDWSGKQVVLFACKVQFRDKMVDAIRIRLPKPQTVAAERVPNMPVQSAPVAGTDETDDLPF